jgi:RNA polymerase sigma-70 factor (ECF subfamily)
VVSREDQANPEQQALLADSIGLALLIVLETLDPVERLAFVLHDLFDLPFEEIAPMVGRSPTATRQLASRARRRVQGGAAPPFERDVARQREVVEAFFAAARAGDLDALARVLHSDVVLRSDRQGVGEQRGAARVARLALGGARGGRTATVLPVVVNGAAGALIVENGQLVTLMGFTVSGGKIVEIDGIVDPERLRRIDLAALTGPVQIESA